MGEKNYKNFVNWYEQLKTQIFITMEEYKEYEKSLGDMDPFSTNEIDFNSSPKISDKIDQTIENMDKEELKSLIVSSLSLRNGTPSISSSLLTNLLLYSNCSKFSLASGGFTLGKLLKHKNIVN